MRHLFFLILFFCTSTAFGQTDSVVTETYDIIYLKDGGILKGQIISFDPSDGDISFVSTKGIKYFLTTSDYTAYKEDIPAKKKKKTQDVAFELLERKENQYELSIGLMGPAYFITGEKSIESDNHLSFDRNFLPISLSAGFGKYIDRKHFIGLGVDFAVVSSLKSSYAINLRYAHQYDSYKKNTALYLPIELTYSYIRHRMPFNIDETDTIFSSDGTMIGSSYPKQVEYDVSINSIGLSIGQGFMFMLSNKNSISFEIALFRYFGIGSTYNNLVTNEPSYDYNVQGLKAGLRYNF